MIITASSAYVALRMGALPWPIIFAAVVSLFFLKAVSRGASTLNEANVTHTVMSAGAMVAGGLAFTIPGAWMLGLADQISVPQMLVVALAGVLLGLVSTAVMRAHFIERQRLEFPIGQAAAQTLVAGERGGKTGAKLFGAMGLAGVFAFLRDALALVPSMLVALPVPGVAFGVYASPMMMSVGFLVGTGAMAAMFAGAVLANFGIVVGGVSLGLLDTAAAQGVVSSLGMGLMVGSGIAVMAKDVVPGAVRALREERGSSSAADSSERASRASHRVLPIALVVAAIALLLCLVLGFGPLVSFFVVSASFVTCAMASQSVGQTGIDPMEIFGLIVLLLVAAFSDVAQVQLFFVAAVIAVACGLAGDVMSDFKAGHVLGTDPKAQIVGQAVGGVIGAFASVAVMCVLLVAYGPEAFGPGAEFAAAQASVVATMVTGIPNTGAFLVGLAVGFALYLAKLPAMMVGLGVYLPFYMSFTAFLGAMCKVAYGAIARRRAVSAGLSGDDLEARLAESGESGLVVASGLLGGESVVGILLALVASATALLA